jgi:hypothetical protein
MELYTLCGGNTMKRWMIVCAILVVGVVSVQGSIVHRYGMSDPNDSVGTANATLVIQSPGTVGFQNGQLMMGNAGQGSNSGSGNYLDLPNGIISALGKQATFETWTTWTSGGMWTRIFDFGNSDGGENTSGGATNSQYLFLTPNGGATPMRFGMNQPTPTRVENVLDSSAGILTQNVEHHIVISYDEINQVVRMYLNGVQVAQGVMPAGFTLAGMTDVNNWLGRAQWPDPMYGGSYNEFRIYNHAMTAAEVAASLKAGADVSIATLVSPADLETGVSATPTLSWVSGYLPADGTDKAFVLYVSKTQADVANAAAGAKVGEFTTTSYTVPTGTPLAKDSTYYWRVDEKYTKAGATDPNFVAGAVQSFETVKTVPVLTTSAPFTLIGGTCSLTVNITSASEVKTVEWFNAADNTLVVEGGKISIVTTAASSILKITNAAVADRVSYYCKVTNTAGSTQTANLLADVRSGLVHQYTFNDGTANDSIGTAHGTVNGTLVIADGMAQFAPRNKANFITLPPKMATSLKSFTFMFWMTSGANEWSRVFDFGKTTAGAGTNYFFYAPPGRFAIKDGATEQTANGPAPAVSTNPVGGTVTQVACVYDTDNAGTPTMRLYTNGVLSATRTNCFAMSVVDDIECWIGLSHYPGDPGFFGTIDEFRIYDYPISAPWIKAAYDAGPNAFASDACNVKSVYDFTGDCKVTLADFALFAAEWVKCGLYSCGTGSNI